MKRTYKDASLYQPEHRWRCWNCGNSWDDYFYACPFCGDEDCIEEILICGECGKEFEAENYSKWGGLCEKCFIDDATGWHQAEEFGDWAKTEVNVNGLLAYAFSEGEINDILMNAFTQLPEEKQRELKLHFADCDAPVFVEWLGGMYDEEEEEA